MGKQSRRSRPEPDGDDINHARIDSGEIPWTAEELTQTLAEGSTLSVTPHDDWDRKPRGILLEHEDGSVSKIGMNPDNLMNQVMGALMKRMRKRGASMEVAMSHINRFMLIQLFMSRHAGRLRREAFVKSDPSDPGSTLISEALLDVLATAKYDGAEAGSDGKPIRSFDAQRVFAEAAARKAADDSR